MSLTLTLPNGKTVEAKMEIGEQIEIEYIQTNGTKKKYRLILTKNETLVLNK